MPTLVAGNPPPDAFSHLEGQSHSTSPVFAAWRGLDLSPSLALDSGPMLMRREQNRTDQRARIVEAARRLFARDGVDEVTMAQVAEEAGNARDRGVNRFGWQQALGEAITEGGVARFHGVGRDALA